jgi:hypothetical protein
MKIVCTHKLYYVMLFFFIYKEYRNMTRVKTYIEYIWLFFEGSTYFITGSINDLIMANNVLYKF